LPLASSTSTWNPSRQAFSTSLASKQRPMPREEPSFV